MFRGGDAGFVRLSSTFPVDISRQHMSPGISIKFLRDAVDSANIIAEFGFDGQLSLNFFENSMSNNIAPSVDQVVIDGLAHFASETDFPWSMGLSEFASVTQEGVAEEQPVFPWKLRFEPATAYANPIEDNNQFDLQQTLKEIPAGVIYKVFAWDKPVELGGTETLIGELATESQLVTSNWADEHMYFRHQRFDEDLQLHPEWKQFTPPLVAG